MSPSLRDRAVRGAGRMARRARAGRPFLSVVVEARGREPDVRAAIDSVRDQPVPQLDILVVLVDELLRPVADEAVRGDWRVRVVEALGADPAAVRRLGAAESRARDLLFLPPRQELLPGAVEKLREQHGDGGGGVVVGGVESGAAELTAPLLGRLLVPRDTWLGVPDDGEPDGQGAALHLITREHLSSGTATLRDRGPVRPRPFERAVDPMPLLGARIAHDEAMLESVAEADRPRRAAGALARDLPPYLLAAERCDEGQWRRLQAHAALFVATAGPELADVPVEVRVLAWLAAEGRRDDLVSFVADRRFAGGAFPTSVRDGLIRAELGVAGVEDHLLAVTEDESPLRARVHRNLVDGKDLVLEVWAAIARLDEEDPTIALRLDSLTLEPTRSSDRAVTRWMAEPDQCHDHGVVTARLPLADLPAGDHRLEVAMADRGVRRHTTLGLALPADAGEGGIRVRGAVLGRGRVELAIDTPAEARVALVGEQRIEGRREQDSWVFDVTTDPWGLGSRPAPPGAYRLEVTFEGAAQPVVIGDELARRLPEATLDDLHRTVLEHDRGGRLVLRLAPPLADDEAGPWAQRQLQHRYAEVTEPLDPRLAYFQSFLGQSPTDHPGAIQAALERVRLPDVRMLWCVADSSVRVPIGAEPVLLRSREWYDAIARAAWIVTNVELEPWFVRRDGQQVLETYHGYPSKAMGLSQWRARGLTPSHVEQMLRRTSGAWNNLLTPIPAMDRLYRENYAFEGRIISQGYPRDDSLVAPGHEQRRVETRARLGISAGQKAVLYAPTWRDDLATDFRSAQAVLHLDVEQAARDLGPEHVIMLRGHRFHATTNSRDRVVDVTSYPEVNDLILAADAAVLDYSSLRFDIALTGCPMVFLVPDLRAYTDETRGFLYSFEDSAPGPFAESTAEVVDALRDLRALEAEWRDRIAAFNATYQPNADGRAAARVVAEFFAPLLEER